MPQDPDPTPDLTQFLADLRRGEHEPEASELLPHVCRELHAIASACLRGRRDSHTLQATALVNEAYLRLFPGQGDSWNDRAHFFAVAATAMRRMLVDHVRARSSEKRGGGRDALELDEAILAANSIDYELLDLDEQLSKLAALDERQARIVELRFFAGLEMREIAELLDTSLSTVEREWRAARAWLGVRLSSGRDE